MPECDNIKESQYDQLDNRLQVFEAFMDSIQAVSKNKKQLS